MGGAVGHLYHLYDNPDLTFGEIKDIIKSAAAGKLTQVSEKLDGLNLVFTWDESGSGLRVARNAGDIKSGGMDASALAAKFADRGNLSDAFNSAFKVLNQALGSLPPQARAKVFGPDGRIWYSMELIYSSNPNVIQYDSNNIVFHGWPVFKALPDGTVEKGPGGGVGYLSKYIEQMQKNVREKDWQVRGPALVALKKMSNKAVPQKALAAINRAMANARVSDGDTIQDYLFAYVLEDAIAAKMPPKAARDIAARVAGIPGAPNLTQIKSKIDKTQVPAVQEYVKVGPKTIKSAIAPIEAAIHDFAVEALRGLTSTLISNSPGEVDRLRAQVQQAIAAIESSGNEQAMAILKTQMSKLGQIENLATPMEGVVFIHNGNAYKFTGAFAPVNQILGLFKYGRGKIKLASEALELMFYGIQSMLVEGMLDEKGQGAFDKRVADARKALEDARTEYKKFQAARDIVVNVKRARIEAGLPPTVPDKSKSKDPNSESFKRAAQRRKQWDDIAVQMGLTPAVAELAGAEANFASKENRYEAKIKKAQAALAFLDPMTSDDDYSNSGDSLDRDNEPESPPSKEKHQYSKEISDIEPNEWQLWPWTHAQGLSITNHVYGASSTGKTGKEESGVGPGEMWLEYIFGAKVSGGSKSYDLTMPDRTTWEVKGLQKETDSIRPGVGGRMAVDKSNQKLKKVIEQSTTFFDDLKGVVDKAFDSAAMSEGSSSMKKKLQYAKTTLTELNQRVVRGEIPPDWIDVRLRRALFYLAEFKAKYGSDPDAVVTLILGDAGKKVQVPRSKAIELAREYDPDALSNFNEFERAAANLKDTAFTDPAQFIDDWFDSVDIDSIFSKVTGGLILVTPTKYLVMPKETMRDKLIFTKISGGVPKINLIGTEGSEEEPD